MEEDMTLDEFKIQLKPLIFFGEMKLNISKEDDGFKIEVFDHEEGQLVNLKGEVVEPNYSSTTKNATFYTDEKGEINFIEHGMGAFTKANKDKVIYLANFIGEKIEMIEEQKEL